MTHASKEHPGVDGNIGWLRRSRTLLARATGAMLILAAALTCPASGLAADCEEAYKDLKTIEGNEVELLARVGKYPDCAKLHVKLADVYFGKQTWSDARKYYELGQKQYPDSKYIQNQLYEVAKHAPVQLDGTTKLDLAGEVSRRGLGGTRKLPTIAMEVHFGSGSAAIAPADAQVLDGFAETVKNGFSNFSFEIQGFTDAQGGEKENLALSERRAAAVREYLIKKHSLDGSRLTAKGYGAAQPLASNETDEGRAKNRRVQFQGKQ